MVKNGLVVEIADKIIKGEIIPFIGAGFSTYNGLPDWTNLLSKVIEKIKEDDHPDFQNPGELAKLQTLINKSELQHVADSISNRSGEAVRTYIKNVIEENSSAKEGIDIPIFNWNCRHL